MPQDIADELFETLVEDPDPPGDLSDAAREAEPANFLRHLVSLAGSKVADGLLNPKLVLSWLLTHLGAGALWTGLLVPVREAGALLPQLFTSGAIHGLDRRKWAWAAGSAGQGLATAGIVVVGLTLEGGLAGALVVGLLAVLALSRSVCSVAYKDVQGKTIGKTHRGTVTGTASSAASVAVVVFALLLMLGVGDRFALVVGALGLAAAGWLLSAAVFATLREEPAPGKALGARQSVAQLKLLGARPQLRRFIAARSLLVGTALAPPYLVLLASGEGEGAFEQLGALVLASAAASFVSSWVWGRLSDRSSRQVLIWSGVAGAVALSLALLLRLAGLAGSAWAIPAVLFGLMVAYHGVRQGRGTYLVDLADQDERAAYTAVSNTVVGIFLLAAGGAAAGLAALSVPLVIGVFAVLSAAGALVALGLKEVEQ